MTEDEYQEKMLNKYLDSLDETEEDVDEYENAMCDKGDAERELERERDD